MTKERLFDKITDAVEDLKRGKIIIVVDDEDRENEGDLIMLADKTTPEDINYMAKYGRGLICVAMTQERLQELDIPPMVGRNTALMGTAFTVSVDLKYDIATGISASDRARTITGLIDPKAKGSDFARPGHIFPIAAEEGALVLLHNEGNIVQVAMRAEKHIVLVGTDKIYPNLEEAINMVKLQTFYATGSLRTSFVNIITGPSQTADIEKQLIKGVHGPREICLIFVDNHRSNIANSEYKELLYCIGCGQCLLVCPAYSVYGSEFGVNNELGGKGVMYSFLSGKASGEANKGLDLCLSCRKCQQNCPLGIDMPSMVNKLRLQEYKRLFEPHLSVAYDFVSSHVRWIGSAIELGALLGISKLLQSRHDD